MSLNKGRPASAGQSLPKDIDNIYYTAFSESIILGCFYDARKCSVLSQLPLNKKLIINSAQYRSVTCTIMTDNTLDIEDFFRTIGITDELWLNLTLNSIPTENMGLLCYYSFAKNTNTRYLYYYYVSEENSISSEKNVVKIGLPTDIPHFSTTHVISTVRVGIQAFIVLQLSSNDQINLDRLLEKIKDQLIMNKFELSKVDKLLLNEITVTKIFSNTQSLHQFSKLEDICQTIIQMKVHSYKHSPLQYALRPINWFYPTYPTEKAKYIALEQETIKIIKKYLLHLLSKLSDIKICFNSKVKHTLQKYLEVQYDTLRQQFINVDTIYSNEIKRLRDLVIKMRHGKTEQKMIDELLVDKSNDSLENNLDHTKKYIQSLTEKVQLINELNEQNISYLNMAHLLTQANHDLNTIFQDILQDNKSQLIFCSSDHLKDGNSSSWTIQYANWMKTCETDPSLTLVYADFSYSSFHLTEVRILRAISLHDATKKLN
ncbi:unnamed protein product [Adineta steineri]|uniref:Uncharacterized protein n=1 Tax=Adineta steineri TaxID=433720 RepID=A0A813Z2K5_9BILA|nr:unnamed protein product [Adineta steineri]CAF0893252.1 unnamed protein product [Adineta steineri]CAF0963011.1 unnamed protein product [Adineta steineri]